MDDVAVIILAAGKGTRMKSDQAKVLHQVAGTSMVVHVTRCARGVTADNIHLVVGHQAEAVKAEVRKSFSVRFAYQKELLGTGDAVKAALPDIASHVKKVLVLCGDVPLIRRQTLQELVQSHDQSRAVLSVLAVKTDSPHGYGRIITSSKGDLLAIREEADASGDEKKIKVVNSGVYCFDKRFLQSGIRLVNNTNEQAEYYLTDLVEIAVSRGQRTHVQITEDSDQVMGVNTVSELARAQALFRKDPYPNPPPDF